MSVSQEILSDITVFMKYARYLPEKGRRETWDELVTRNKEMHQRKYPQLFDEIEMAYKFVYEKKVLPSMRSLQFGGRSIELNNARIYNCCFLPIDSIDAFSEIMFLLLGGTGVGFSVQRQDVKKLPAVVGCLPGKEKRFVVGDNVEGWAQAVKVLFEAYTQCKRAPNFDYSDIRPKGAMLVTSGGKAPGPEPLKACLGKLEAMLKQAQGRKLTTLECHDLVCHIADCVLAGGIRRAALISVFAIDDEDMLACKSGEWWKDNPQRGRANNSAIILRHRVKKSDFMNLWKRIQESGCGEPGFLLSNDKSWATNPCLPSWAKVLTPYGIRELSEISIGDLIWSAEGWTGVVDKWSTGVKSVYSYHTTAGTFYGTQNHRVVSNGSKVEAVFADSLDIITGPSGVYSLNTQDIIDGIVFGDGSVHKASNNLIYLCVGENDKDYFSSEIAQHIGEHRPGLAQYAYEVDTKITADELPLTFMRTVPKRYTTDPRKAAAFLRGLYSANGSVVDNRVTLKAASKDVVLSVQLMLNSLGIRSYYTTNKPKSVEFVNGEYSCKESYDLNITSDRFSFLRLIGFIQKYKNEKIQGGTQKGKVNYDIIRTEHVSDEEVFDITVDNQSHTFWCNGVNTSNCGEIALRPFQMCNLTEVNASTVESQEDLNQRCRVAAFIGTMQAGYTDFHYLRDVWQETTEKDSLLGVGMTGIASNKCKDLDLAEAAQVVNAENDRVSALIGINKSARATTVKPSGTSSMVLGCSSGIHGWHNDYYIRRMRVGKNESIYTYLRENHPELVEDEYFRPDQQAVISVPQKAPGGALYRTENVFDLLERVKRWNLEWIAPGHRDGQNSHNVSATISIKDGEWESVGEWMWENRDSYTGLSVLPYNGGTYLQAPFEDITKEQYEEMESHLHAIDLTQIVEYSDETNLAGEAACSGGKCEIV